MIELPILTTDRLILRPFNLNDAPVVQRLADHKDIAATTTVPHPYEDGFAEQWIGTHQEEFEKGESVIFAVVLRSDNSLIGSISILRINNQHSRAEIGYWIGVPYQCNGYCTEAGREALKYAFDELALNRVSGSHLAENPASGRVLKKIGFKREGYLRQHVNKWGAFKDVVVYGVLREDYESEQKNENAH